MATETTKSRPRSTGTNCGRQLIKLALELGPLVVFFIVNTRRARHSSLRAIRTAFMGAMVISLLLSWLLLKRVAVMPLVTGIVVLVFGGLTLYFQDDDLHQDEADHRQLAVRRGAARRAAVRAVAAAYVFGDVYKLKPEGWRMLTLRWGLFFFVLAVAQRDGVAACSTTDIWVAFKVWGIMPLTVVFSMLQLPVLKKYAPDHGYRGPATHHARPAALGTQACRDHPLRGTLG